LDEGVENLIFSEEILWQCQQALSKKSQTDYDWSDHEKSSRRRKNKIQLERKLKRNQTF